MKLKETIQGKFKGYQGNESVTLIFSDDEGWTHLKKFKSEEEADQFVTEHAPQGDWTNPTPILITGSTHKVKYYEGYRYH